MAQDTRVAKVLLRIQTEKAAIDKSKQDLQAFQKEFRSFAAESEKTNRVLEQQVRIAQAQQRASLDGTAAMHKWVAEERALLNAADDTTDALNRQKRAAEEANRAASGSGRLRNLGRAARTNLPAVPIGGGFSSEQVARAVEGLGFLDDTIAKLGNTGKLAALGIVAAVATAAIALTDLKKRNDEAKASAEAALAAQGRYLELVRTGTAESVKTALEQARINQQIAQDQHDFLTAVQAGLEQAVDAGGAFNRVTTEAGVLLNDVLGTQPEIAATRQAVDAAKAALLTATAETYALERALNSTEVATNTAADAEKELAAARQAITDQRIQTQLQAELQAAKLSASNIQSRIDDLLREQQAIYQIVKAGDVSVELSEQLTQRQRDVTTELQVMIEALPTAQAREKIQGFIDGLLNIPKTVGQVTNAIEALQKASADISELKADFFAKTKEITDREQDALNKAIADRDRAIREAEQRAADQRADLRFDEQTAEIRHLQAIMRIRRNANRDINRAIADRDAVSLSEARQNKKDQLADQKQQYDNEQRELRRRNQIIDRELRQATSQIQARYAETTEAAKQAAIRDLTIAQQKFAKELEIKTAAYQKLLTADQQAAANVINVHANYWQNALVLAQRAVTAISSASNQAAQVKRFGNPGASSGGKVPSLDTGGKILQSGYAFLHRNEVVINPARQNQQGMAGLTINITAANRQELHRQIDRKLDDFIVTNF